MRTVSPSRTAPRPIQSNRKRTRPISHLVCFRGPVVRISGISSPTGYQQDDLAVVRRRTVGMDDMRAVLSACSIGRLWLRVPPESVSFSATTSRHSLDSGSGNHAVTADNTRRFMETDRRIQPNTADTVTAAGECRTAVFSVVGNCAAYAVLVRPSLSRTHTVPALCIVKCWIVGGSVKLSVCCRAAATDDYTGNSMVRGIWPLRAAVWMLGIRCLEELARRSPTERYTFIGYQKSGRFAHNTATCRQASGRATALLTGRAMAGLDEPFGIRFALASSDYKPHLSRNDGGAVVVGCASEHLFVDIHHKF